jgi:predicted ribosome quality control (RQC) complex YloA/Tae2 family protein
VLSLVELERAARVLDRLVSGDRLQGAVQPDASRVVLSTYGQADPDGQRRRHLLLCSDPRAARVALLPRAPRALPRPPAFTQYLRAHLEGARVVGAQLVGGDRLVAIDLEAREGAARLLLSILGRRSNLYLLDAEARLVAALRPLAATRPELALGEPWREPASRPPRSGEDRFAAEPDAALLQAIERFYAEAESDDENAALRRRVGQVLRKEARRLDRKLEKVERELEAAQLATQLARQGELLKGALGRVRRGDREVVVRDHASGEDLRIVLDPALGPSENLERLFKRYHKAVRRLTKGGAQDVAVRDARRDLRELEDEFARSGDDEAGLRALAARPALAALLRRHEPPAPPPRQGAAASPEVRIGKRVVPRRLAPRRYRSAGDLEIWVGRSDAANDFLTTRLARGKDLFFHLDGAPGSHVVLRTEGRPDPPSEAVLDACELAVHFSKQRKATRADVHVVPIRNVKKPKGAKPGLVMVHGGRTVHLRRSPARLERVLGARIEAGEEGAEGA